jgi:hypothetical protein
VLAGVDITIMQWRSELEEVDFDWNNVIAHGKSFTVLAMLEKFVGGKTFFTIFKTCLNRFKGKNVTLEMFQKTCEEISGINLGWFFYQWYQTPAVFDYRIMNVRTSK